MRFPGHAQVKVKKGVPEGWEVTRLSDMVEFLSGHPFKSDDLFARREIRDRDDQERTRWILHSGMHRLYRRDPFEYEETLCASDRRHAHVVNGSRRSGVPCVRGQPATQPAGRKADAPDGRHSSQFVFLTFNNKSMIQLIKNLSLGSTAQLNLSPVLLGKQKMVRPSLELIRKFEETTLPILKVKLSLLQQNMSLKAMRERLLPRLMSGKLDVENLDITFPPSMVNEVDAVLNS